MYYWSYIKQYNIYNLTRREIDDIFAIVIAWSNAVSDSFELSYGTNILL
jgi:hypothetical protein